MIDQNDEKQNANAGQKIWATPRVIDLDRMTEVEAGSFAGPESFSGFTTS